MGNWVNFTEEELEEFIRENKERFEKIPRPEMEDNFLIKLIKFFDTLIQRTKRK